MLAISAGPEYLTLFIADYDANIRAESLSINHLDYLARLCFNITSFFHKLVVIQSKCSQIANYCDKSNTSKLYRILA